MFISQRPKQLINRKLYRGIKTETAYAFLSLVTSASRIKWQKHTFPLQSRLPLWEGVEQFTLEESFVPFT